MTLWEFRCVQNGWRKAQGGDEGPKPPTKDEFEDAMDRFSKFL